LLQLRHYFFAFPTVSRPACEFLLWELRNSPLASTPHVATVVVTTENAVLELKVRKIGDSLGIVLPKEAVSRLKAGEGARLFLIEAPEGYQLTGYEPAFKKKMVKAEDIIRRYRKALHTLAS
jgi:putative addiction module antidote